MLVNPVNNTNQQSMNFKSKIVGKEVISESCNLVKNSIKSGSLKDLNFAKDFYDSLNRIKNDKSVKVVEFVKKPEGIEAYADGALVKKFSKQSPNVNSDYLSVMAVKEYSDTLNTPVEKTILDNCKQGVIKAMEIAEGMQSAYAIYLEKMMNSISKSI